MLQLVLIVWWVAPIVLVGLGVLARRWYDRRVQRRVDAGSVRLRAMHERHAASALRPNGHVEHVVPMSRRRDGGAA